MLLLLREECHSMLGKHAYRCYERNQVFKRQDKLNALGVQFAKNHFNVLNIKESGDVEDHS